MHLVDFLDNSSGISNGDAKFIDFDNNISLCYQEMVNVSWHVAEILIKKGVKPNDIVATYAPNSVAAYACVFGMSRVGGTWLPLNARNTAEANLKLLDKSKAALLIVDEETAANVPELKKYIESDRCILFNAHSINGQELKSLTFEPTKDQKNLVIQNDGEAAVVSLLSTGGTTGDSKLAEWTGVTWEAMKVIQAELMPQPDIPSCYLVSTPMTHAAGVASFVPILQGATVLVMDGLDTKKLLSAIENYKVTHIFLPPTAIYMLMSDPNVRNYDFSSLRYFWYAAAPMSAEKLREAMDIFGPVMVQSYGQAEAPMLCTVLTAQDHIDAMKNENYAMLRSCGKISPHVELVIMDDDGNILTSGQEGEVAIKGGLCMRGYHNDPEATKAIRTEGWQRTGDMGVMDKEGYLFIVDRKRDMIISGGFNVYPSEIEQLLWGRPEIQDCAVIGVPDEKWGEKVTAVIELKDNSDAVTEQELITFCKKNLGSVKAPKQILFWKELPRSPVGKVLKKEIRKFFWDKVDRKI